MNDDRSRRTQKWVNEEFYKVLDVFGFRSVMFVEWGFRPADVRRTTERVKHPMAVVKQWVRTAEQEQKLAEETESAGNRESAAEFYYRAALYYGPACGVIHANTPRKLELYKRLIGRITLADVSSSFVMEEIKATTVLPLDYAPERHQAPPT